MSNVKSILLVGVGGQGTILVSKLLTQGLIRLGLLKGSLRSNLESHTYRKFYMHKPGHWLGLDVHDAGDYEAPLPVGAVFTVEPGVYIPEKGFGVRIEDEVLITPSGYRLLSAEIPRKLEDVEAWVARARTHP